MRSINARFQHIQKQQPNVGDFLCLKRAVKNQNFSRFALRKAFNELVPKDDYDEDDKKTLIDELESSTKPSEEQQNDIKNRPGQMKSIGIDS